MKQALTALALACAVAISAAPREEIDVQGMYEGTWKDGGKEGKLEARVVALGNQEYQVFAVRHLDGGKTEKVELKGKTDGDTVTFEGAGWTGTYAEGAIEGAKLALKRTVPESPTFGRKPPEGAIVLLDGKHFERMERGKQKDGSQSEWEIGDDGSVAIPKRGMRSRISVEGSYDLHVEFRVPFRPDKRGQGRGNSGVYLPCRTEIQVLDSFGMTTYTGGGCGGLYRWKDPDTFDKFNLSSYPPLVWQTYDVEYRVRTDGGRAAGLLTVLHNGVKIHDNVRLKRQPRKGGFSFQDHGNPVRYRNIWVKPIKED